MSREQIERLRETDRAFAIGDRVQFTAPFREQRVANRELGTITALPSGTMKGSDASSGL